MFHLGNKLQQFGFTATVYNFAHITSRQFTVLYFQLIGIHIVYVIFVLQVIAEISEPTRENGYFVTILFQYKHQTVDSLRNGQMLSDIFHDRHIQPFQQSHPLGETFLKVYLPTHGPLGNGPYLFTYSGTVGQFVDDFRLNQSGIHIKTNQAAHAAVHVVQLE